MVIHYREKIFPVKIEINETHSISHAQEYVCIGIPFPNNLIQCCGSLELRDEDGEPIEFQVEPTAFWPGRSIRWIKLEFFAHSNSNDHFHLSLSNHNNSSTSTSSDVISAQIDHDKVRVDTGAIIVN
jgi:hypothetical protein